MSSDKMLLAILKPFLPKLKGYLAKGEEGLRKYLESIPLEGNETHIVAFSEINEGTVYMCIGAFTDKTFTRFIGAKPLTEWINSLIESAL